MSCSKIQKSERRLKYILLAGVHFVMSRYQELLFVDDSSDPVDFAVDVVF